QGRVMRDHAIPGSMCAVRASLERITPYLAPHAGRVVVSAFNTPESLTLSGESPALRALVRALEADGIKTRSLASYAFHSPLMLPAEPPLRLACEAVRYSQPRISFVSTVDGGRESDAAR